MFGPGLGRRWSHKERGPNDWLRMLLSEDPAQGLSGVRELRKLLDEREEVHVRGARTQGWTWSWIALYLGPSRQAVHRKWAGSKGES